MTETKGRWTKFGAASAVTAVAGAGVMIFALNPVSSQAAATKVTICHRNNDDKNPYVVNSPSAAGVFNGHLKKHTGPVWNDTLKAQHIKWGDIIPPFEYKGAIYSQNWSAAGQAIWENGCKIPNAPETSEPPVTSEPPETSSSALPTETVTDTAVVEPTSPGPLPSAVAAGAHSVSSTSVALGGVLMAVGVGGLLTAARPWKRGSH